MSDQAGKYRTEGGGKQDYETDPEFFDIINFEFRFDVDVTASKENTKCANFYTKEDDALSIDWHKSYRSAFSNPPYGRGIINKFFEKYWTESQYGMNVVALVHTCTDTKYWDNWVWDKAAEVRHMKGRLPFWGREPDENGRLGNTSDLPHSLVIYRPYYLGPTLQTSWDWKAAYFARIGNLPVRDKKTKAIKHFKDEMGHKLSLTQVLTMDA